jgi:hypothetical protein
VAKTDLVKCAYVLVVLSIMQPIYASEKFPDYPVRPAGDYAVTAKQGDVTIGLEPVEDPKEQKIYFDTELTAKGVIPVFIVMQNGSTGDSFLFDKTKVTYGPVDSTLSTPKMGEKAAKGANVAYTASALAISPAGMVVAIALASKAVHGTQIQESILKKEMQSKTLSPGVSAHGFLYVQVPKKGPREKIHLQIPVTKASTEELVIFDLFF